MSITKSAIEHRIKKVQFWNPKETTTTICCILFDNGYTEVGTASCAHEKDFDKINGQNIAYENAIKNSYRYFAWDERNNSYNAKRKADNQFCANTKNIVALNAIYHYIIDNTKKYVSDNNQTYYFISLSEVAALYKQLELLEFRKKFIEFFKAHAYFDKAVFMYNEEAYFIDKDK